MLGDGQDLGDDDLDVVGADACRDARHSATLVDAGGRGELTMSLLELDLVEEGGNLRRAVLVARQEDVFGELARCAIDVVLAIRVGYRNQSACRRHPASCLGTLKASAPRL